jgi:putative toxin-antitoxin system antitoxin component (TIGR02293 family)
MKTPERRVSRPQQKADRAIRSARVVALAERIFGDKAKAGRWMRKPKRALGGAAPLAYLASKGGAQHVEEMLYRIDSGFFA